MDTMKGLFKMNCPYCNSTHIHSRGIEDNKRKYTCCDCGKNFREGTLERLTKRNNSPKCPHCGCRTRKAGFDRRRGNKIQYYKCTVCGKYISEAVINKPPKVPNTIIHCINCNSLNITKRGHTADGRQRYECKDCGRVFNDNPIYRRLSEKEKRMIQLFRSHLNVPVSDIAKELGRNEETIRSVSHKYIESIKNGGPIIVPNIFRPEINNELKISTQFTDMEQLYIYENYIRQGLSYEDIAEEFHCSVSTIRGIKRKFKRNVNVSQK